MHMTRCMALCCMTRPVHTLAENAFLREAVQVSDGRKRPVLIALLLLGLGVTHFDQHNCAAKPTNNDNK